MFNITKETSEINYQIVLNELPVRKIVSIDPTVFYPLFRPSSVCFDEGINKNFTMAPTSHLCSVGESELPSQAWDLVPTLEWSHGKQFKANLR